MNAKLSELVDTAVDLFKRKGYPAASVQEIVEAMDVSKGMFYHYLSSKDELLYLIHEEFIDYELKLAEEVLRSEGTAKAKLERMADILIETIDRYQNHVVVFFRDMAYLSEEYWTKIKEKRDRFAAIVSEMIEAGVRDGEFRQDLPSQLAVFAFFGMHNWTYQWYRPGGAFSPRQISAAFRSIFFDGFAAKGERTVAHSGPDEPDGGR